MNPRTCQLATQEWVSKNITVNKEGIPEAKKGKKSQPWVMTLFFRVSDCASPDLTMKLQLAAKVEPVYVRCWELETSEEKKKNVNLLAGYSFDEKDAECDEDLSDAESEKTVFGDEDGLEGLVIILAFPTNTNIAFFDDIFL